MKPLSEEDPVIREEGEEGEGEDEASLKQKKPSDTDDDDEEPPPPYTTYDPQEEEEKLDDDSKKKDEDGASGKGGVADGEGLIPLEDLNCSPDVKSKTGGGGDGSGIHPTLIPEPSLGFQVQESGTKQQQQTVKPESDLTESATTGRGVALNSASESESDTSSRPATSSPLSPADLSRISSPEKGRTLSEMTRITPEDEARVNYHADTIDPARLPSFTPPSSSFFSSGDCRTASSDSNTTLVNSQSQQSPLELTGDSNSTVTPNSGGELSNSQLSNSQPPVAPSSSSSSSGGGGGLKLAAFLHKGKGKGKKHDKAAKSNSSESKSKDKSHKKHKDKGKELADSSQSPKQSAFSGKKGKEVKDRLDRNGTPQSPQGNFVPLKMSGGGGASQAGLNNSQESFVDGLSPELSDYGEHSNEVDLSPREAKILRAGYIVGLSIDMDEKNSCIVVKAVSNTGAVGRDGRIRVGDRIEAINGKSFAGLSLNRAKGILKRAGKSDEICITYSPAPGPAQFSIPLSPPTSSHTDTPPTTGAGGQEKGARKGAQDNKKTQKQNPYYSIASMAAPLRDQQDSTTPQGSGTGGNIQMTPQQQQPMVGPPPPPQQVQGIPPPPHLIGSVQAWGIEGMSPYHHIQPQGYYATTAQRPKDDQMGKPPPPYLYHHQAPPPGPPPTAVPGQIIGTAQTPYGPALMATSQAPPPQMTWSLQQQITTPQG